MANIDTYLAEIRSAIYGEEVRGSIINALEAQNNETENNTSIVDSALIEINQAVTEAGNASAAADTAANNANTAATSANTAADAANAAASSANTASTDASQAADRANSAAANADAAADTATSAADEAISAANTATTAASNADSAANYAETSVQGAAEAAEAATEAAGLATEAANHGVQEYKVEYNGSESGTEPPEDGWLDYIPQVAEGDFLWTRVTVVFLDGTEVPFYSVSKMGVTSGGISGIMSMKVYFAVSGSPYYYPTHGGATIAKLGAMVLGTAALGNSGDWFETIPEVKEDEYLWAAITFDYSDGLTYWTEPMRLTDPNCKAQAIGTSTIDSWFEEEA